MKALKLTASSAIARSIAACLVGSRLKTQYGVSTLVGQTTEGFVWRYADADDTAVGWTGTFDTITILPSTAKFCPFVAMREGVSVIARDVDGETMRGAIYSIVHSINVESVIVVSSGGGVIDALLSEITIDQTWASQQDGVEIVEVEE